MLDDKDEADRADAQHILVTGAHFEARCLERLWREGFSVEHRADHLDENSLIAALHGKHQYIMGGEELVSGTVLRAADSLRHIAFCGVGYGSFIETAIASTLGIAVSNTPRTSTGSVVELTVGHILSLWRGLTHQNSSIKRGVRYDDVTHSLSGKTAGIVGLGTIGSQIAMVLHVGFGMSILYTNRGDRSEVALELDAHRVDLDVLLASSDVVILMVPTSAETSGMIGACELQTMKSSSILINTARASLVEPKALYAALRDKTIAGAAMDGYYVEPLPTPENDDFGLLSLSDRVFIVTPHTGAATHEAQERMYEEATQNALEFSSSGGHTRNNVNPDFFKPSRRYRAGDA